MRSIAFAFLICFALCSAPVAGAAPSSYKGWVLQQVSDFYGRQTAQISDAGIRVVSQRTGLTLLVLPPDWRMIMYNDRSKMYYQAPLAAWKEKISFKSEEVKRRNERRAIKVGVDTIAGVPANHYYLVDPAARNSRHSRGSAFKVSEGTVEMWTAANIKIAPQIADAIARLSGTPMGFGLPLKVLNLRSRKESTTSLDTLKCYRSDIPKSMYNLPKGYKRAKSEMELLLEDSGGEVTDFFNSLDDLPRR